MAERRLKERWDKTGIGLTLVAAVVLGIGYFVTVQAIPFRDGLASEITDVLIVEEEVKEDTSNRAIFASQTTPAYDFIVDFANFTPEGYKEPQVQLNGTASTFATWICSNIKLDPAPMLGARSDTNKNLAVITHTYGAGQASKVIREYESGAQNCRDRDGNGGLYQSSPIGVNATGFTMTVSTRSGPTTYVSVWTRGDVIVAVSSPSIADLRSVTPEYDEYLLGALKDTQCLATEVASEDYVRSPYYKAENYRGWERGRDVSIPGGTFPVYAGALSQETALTDTGPRIGVLDADMLTPDDKVKILDLDTFTTTPLAPIPDGVPAVLPKSPKGLDGNPSNLLKKSSPSKPTLTGTIPERVVDPDGPGCGWLWSGQLSPEWDDTEEKNRVDALVAGKQDELSSNYSNWLIDYRKWYMKYLEDSVYIAAWNEYAEEANSVTEQWREVNSIRADYRTKLDAYWRNINAREIFIENQNTAQEEYDNYILMCEAREQEKLEALEAERNEVTTPGVSPTPSPTPSPSPSPTPTPSHKPESELDPCPPERPEILDEAIPEEPTPPTKPSIPLPDAWDDIPD